MTIILRSAGSHKSNSGPTSDWLLYVTNSFETLRFFGKCQLCIVCASWNERIQSWWDQLSCLERFDLQKKNGYARNVRIVTWRLPAASAQKERRKRFHARMRFVLGIFITNRYLGLKFGKNLVQLFVQQQRRALSQRYTMQPTCSTRFRHFATDSYRVAALK
jgi:hypothetical protein